MGALGAPGAVWARVTGRSSSHSRSSRCSRGRWRSSRGPWRPLGRMLRGAGQAGKGGSPEPGKDGRWGSADPHRLPRGAASSGRRAHLVPRPPSRTHIQARGEPQSLKHVRQGAAPPSCPLLRRGQAGLREPIRVPSQVPSATAPLPTPHRARDPPQVALPLPLTLLSKRESLGCFSQRVAFSPRPSQSTSCPHLPAACPAHPEGCVRVSLWPQCCGLQDSWCWATWGGCGGGDSFWKSRVNLVDAGFRKGPSAPTFLPLLDSPACTTIPWGLQSVMELSGAPLPHLPQSASGRSSLRSCYTSPGPESRDFCDVI